MTHRTVVLVLGALAVGVWVVILRAAWLADDAYITIRAVDNLVHGWGPRWNVAERVQVYTHPLWFWCLVPVYAAVGSARLTLLASCLVAAAGSLMVLVRAGAARPGMTAAVLLALAGSKSFVEYSTSGLEEPLLFCLVGAAIALANTAPQRVAALVTLSGLVFLTRMDAVLLVLPLVATALFTHRREVTLRTLAGLIPAIGWLAFATFYYGVPFPNTAYAKLGHGAPRMDLVHQGVLYLSDFLVMDPVGSLLIVAGVGVAAIRRRWEVPGGIALWIGYVVWVGGDFMSGRLLAPAAWAAAVTLVITGPQLRLPAGVALGAAAATLAFLGTSPAIWGHPPRAGDGRTDWRVTDERQFYFPTTGLLIHGLRETAQEHPWPRRVLAARDRGESVQTFKWVGFAGYFAGPGVHLIDEYGVTDPLLARLPAQPDWAPGHFLRTVPEGYRESVLTGTNAIRNDEISRYYARLARVTRGPLLAPGRVTDIFWLNFRQPRIAPPPP